MLHFKNLGSGSTGNATLIEASGLWPVRLLVDCGLGQRQLAARLAEAGLCCGDLDAVFITHEHSDHIGCARQLSLKHQLPVWMSQGTYDGCGAPELAGGVRLARDGEAIDLGALQVTPFAVPHDAREPLQLSCTDGASKLGVLTDLGHATPSVLAHLAGCHALLLECNHDPDLLARSSYPPFLKRRVAGPYGHLSNAAAAEIAGALSHKGLRHLVAAHLSQQNNTPAMAQQALAQTLGGHTDVLIADAQTGSRWVQV